MKPRPCADEDGRNVPITWSCDLTLKETLVISCCPKFLPPSPPPPSSPIDIFHRDNLGCLSWSLLGLADEAGLGSVQRLKQCLAVDGLPMIKPLLKTLVTIDR